MRGFRPALPRALPASARPVTRPVVIRLRNWVGDVVLSVPTLRRIEQAGFTLHLIGKGWAPGLLAGFGWQVHRLPGTTRERIAQLRSLRRTLAPALAGSAAPAGGSADAIAFPYSFGSALEMRLAGWRALGFAYEGRSLLLARALPKPRGVHTLQEYWQLGDAFLGTSAPVPASIGWRIDDGARDRARALLQARGVAPGFVLACPYAGGTYDHHDKRWPHFPAYVQQLPQALGRPVVLCPGPGEEVLVSHRDYPGAVVLEGVDLGAYAALMEQAALVVSNDTGPGHLAAAVGVPLLSVLGPTVPGHWGAWGPSVHIERRWPQWPAADAILQRTHALLEQHARGPAPAPLASPTPPIPPALPT